MVDPGVDGGMLFRVLVADDSSEIREMLSEALSAIECSVTCVKDGVEALANLQDGMYDLLITDYEMPRLDGLALLRSMRAGNGRLPSILITGRISLDLIKEVKQIGGTFVLPKPVAISSLRSIVKTIREQQPQP